MISSNRLADNLRHVPGLLLIATVTLNIFWPLTNDGMRDFVTMCGVVTFFAESKTHAFITRGWSYTVRFVGTVLILAFIAEVVGTHTGFPFGTYSYSNRLGPVVLSVPLLIPLAWFMMMYPCLLIAQSLSAAKWKQVGIASWLMASWDLFLDPQMVNEGYWVWFTTSGQETTVIPWTNFVGWFIVSALVFTAVLAVLPKNIAPTEPQSDWVPRISVMWVWLGSFTANIFTFAPFLNQPRVAISGLIGMSIVLVPWLLNLRSQS